MVDDWEQRKLGKIVPVVMGQSPDSKNYTNESKFPILVQGNADMKDGAVFPRVYTKQITKTAKKSDLILSVRAPVGDIGKTSYDVVIGRGVASLAGNEFIFQLMTRLKNTGYWSKLSSGSTFESINSTDIKNAPIFIASHKEQELIGKYLKIIDSTITLHQRTLLLPFSLIL